MTAYTDIEPLDAETFWAIITKTDFFEQVLNKISDDTCSLLSDIHETIKYKRQKNGNVFSGLLNKISNISDKIKDIDIPKLFDLAESISNKDEAKIVDEILELKNNSEKQNVEE